MEIFSPWKLANTTNRGLSFGDPGVKIFASMPISTNKQNSACLGQQGKGVSNFFNDPLAVILPTPPYTTELSTHVPFPQLSLALSG